MTYTHTLETDPRAIKRLRQQETANAQPLYGAFPVDLLGFSGQVRQMPMAFLDVRKRPAVADLWRVLFLEPDHQGDVVTAWRVLTGGGPSLAILSAEWTSPVRLRLRLVFSFRAHRPFLELAATLGCVLLANKPLAECARFPRTIGVPVESDVLAAALAFDALAQRANQ
jgi:hypothetical protein